MICPAIRRRSVHLACDFALVRAQVCPKDYLPALLKWIDEDNLPTYLGGKSKATLLDDSGPWNDPALIAQIEAELKAVRRTSCCARNPSNKQRNGSDRS